MATPSKKTPWYSRRTLWLSLLAFLLIWIAKENFWSQEEQSLRQTIREQLIQEFPEAHQKYQAQYGLQPALPKQAQHQHALLFIHGLDEPGGLWQESYRHLQNEPYELYQLRYPNDQKIHYSSALLISTLLELSQLPYQSITLVCHSMGGLVSRNALGHPDFQYEQLQQQKLIAPIPQVFLVATPNHGSDWARLRGFLEIRDQISQAWNGQWHWLQVFLDGNGEAKGDLIPHSPFLTQLAQQNLPPHTQWITINALFTQTEPDSPLASWLDPIGDGVVPYQSAQWEHAHHQHTVTANHNSILRNYPWQKNRIPPAIPIIQKHLQKQQANKQQQIINDQ